MRHGSLFSGGGGFDLAAECVGWTNVFHCEIDPFCSRILKYYWPEAQSFHNIYNFDGTQFKGKIDVLTGGFPCQPFSLAGKRKGTADSRYLWPEMLRVIREIRPRWVVGENVYGILNWNEGLVFEQVHADLEKEGYEVQAYILPAAGVGAPHRRYRVWFIGYDARQEDDTDAHRHGRDGRHRPDEKQPGKGGKHAQRNLGAMGCYDSHSDSKRLEGCTEAGNAKKGWKEQIQQYARLCDSDYWKHWPTQHPLCGGDDGLPAQLDGIAFSKWRRESIKMFGNAVVPQLAMQIFKVIQQWNKKMIEKEELKGTIA